MNKQIYNVLGVMSGTSLDGLDLALCRFTKDQKWKFEIIKTVTIPFYEDLKFEIKNALQVSVVEFIELHRNFGHFIAKQINNFVDLNNVDLIASHGHTVIHFPHRKINFQLGDGAVIASETSKPVVSDFRSIDILLGGQGAPLVPAGEKYLFEDFDTFLNIGGFSNVSCFRNKILAYDISAANFALNYFAHKFDKEFDEGGHIGKMGRINLKLLGELNSIPYFENQAPKSLADHWFYGVFMPIVDKYEISDIDKFRTLYEHIAFQISKNLNSLNCSRVMVTGGGALNKFLMDLIREKSDAEIFIPSIEIIQFKEAIIFAFLGLLRWLHIPNCLADVTGAKCDNIGGSIFHSVI